MKRYKCRECGYVHIGDEPPMVCPVCRYDKEVFFEMEEKEGYSVDYTDLIVTDEDCLKQIMSIFDIAKENAIVAYSMGQQALKEEDLDGYDYFKSIYEKFLKDAAILSMVSGEFLEFNTDSNRKHMEKTIEKYNIKFEKLLDLLEESSEHDIHNILRKK